MIITRKKVDPCLQEDGYAWEQLKDGVQYRVIGIEDEWYRIQSDFADDWRPSLFKSGLFDVLDASVEPEWIVDILHYTEDNEDDYSTSIGFPEFEERGFWEDVYDNKPESHQILIPIFKRLGLVHPEK